MGREGPTGVAKGILEENVWNFPVSYLWYTIGLLAIVLILISIKLLRERFGKKVKNDNQ